MAQPQPNNLPARNKMNAPAGSMTMAKIKFFVSMAIVAFSAPGSDLEFWQDLDSVPVVLPEDKEERT